MLINWARCNILEWNNSVHLVVDDLVNHVSHISYNLIRFQMASSSCRKTGEAKKKCLLERALIQIRCCIALDGIISRVNDNEYNRLISKSANRQQQRRQHSSTRRPVQNSIANSFLSVFILSIKAVRSAQIYVPVLVCAIYGKNNKVNEKWN